MARSLLLAIVALSVALPAASAVETYATVRNAPPEIVAWQDALEGDTYQYRIEGKDGNGIEDLRAITMRFLDVDEAPLTLVEDAEGRADGRRAVVWEGDVVVSGGPLVVSLTLYDQAGDETTQDRVVLGETVPPGPSAPSSFPTLGALGLVGVALSARALRRP